MTLEEFLASTQRKEFGETAEGWKVRPWERLRPQCPPVSFSTSGCLLSLLFPHSLARLLFFLL